MEMIPGGNSRPCSRLTPKHPASHPPTYSLRNSPRFSLPRALSNWRILRTLPISTVTTTTGRCCPHRVRIEHDGTRMRIRHHLQNLEMSNAHSGPIVFDPNTMGPECAFW